MWAVFTENLLKQIEEVSIIKKSILRAITLSLSIGIIFSSIAYNFIYFPNLEIFHAAIIIILSVLIGCVSSAFVFVNMLGHIRNIINELCADSPKWEWLENQYMASDLKNSYLAIKKLHQNVSSSSKLVGISQIASQVAHDIRSPLVALDVIVKDMKDIPEEQRILIRKSTSRIHEIANNLLLQYKSIVKGDENKADIEKDKSSELISDHIIGLISEKRMQYKNRKINIVLDIKEDAYGKFSNIQSSTFNRVFSNLVDNAVEADASLITIILKTISCENSIMIKVMDNGKGMSDLILNRILNGGGFTNKPNGHGLGLKYVIDTISNEWNGRYNIISKPNHGTSIEVILPHVSPPKWFLPVLVVDSNKTIVIVDDDESIHQVWKSRFAEVYPDFKFINLYTLHELSRLCRDNLSDKRYTYLVDYEFTGSNINGLSFIDELSISDNSYLVTSRHDDFDIKKSCEKMRLKIIPKTYAVYIPIHLNINNSKKTVDLILIDDDDSITGAWRIRAMNNNKKISVYNSFSNFKMDIQCFDFHIPIYIDSELHDERKGQDYALDLYNVGFENIYLCTGHSVEYFPEMHWIKGIVGKMPPF